MSTFILDEFLTYKLHRLSKLIDQKLDFGNDGYDISYSEGRVLAVIGYHKTLSVNGLANKSNLDKSQASRATAALVDKGLVAKTKSDRDSRSFELSLTAKGELAYHAIIPRIHERNELALSTLDDDERKQLLALLDKVVDGLG